MVEFFDRGWEDADLIVPLIFVSNFVWAMCNLAAVFMIRRLLGGWCLLPSKGYKIKNAIVRESLFWMQFPLLAVAGHRLYMDFTAVALLSDRDTIQTHYWFPLLCVFLWVFAAYKTILPWSGVKIQTFRVWIWGYIAFWTVASWTWYETMIHLE
jgi:hypothetical protein